MRWSWVGGGALRRLAVQQTNKGGDRQTNSVDAMQAEIEQELYKPTAEEIPPTDQQARNSSKYVHRHQ
jgi:hypothetical protein